MPETAGDISTKKGGSIIHAELWQPKETGRAKEATGAGIHKARLPHPQLSPAQDPPGDALPQDAERSLMYGRKQSEDPAGTAGAG